MAALLTSILKMTILLENLTFERLRIGDGEIDKFDVCENDIEHAKKSGKLSKSGKSKSDKTFKF